MANFSGLFVRDDTFTHKHKSVAIAKSGIYQYHVSELPNLGLNDIPEQHRSRTMFNVLRPAEVLKDAKDLFIELPLTLEHPDVMVTAENIKSKEVNWIGWTGDSSDVVLLEDKDEITINSTLSIMDKDGVDAYDSNVREVSPGYDANFIWKDCKYRDTDVQIVMTKIKEVNHLAVVEQGRGGKDASILDKKFKENEMDEKSVLGIVERTLNKLFGKKDRVLDSIPKSVEKYTDEQKDYLLKETHRLLMHRVAGKTFDSFMPIGYTKDDMGNPGTGEATDSEEEKTEDSLTPSSTASQSKEEEPKSDIAGDSELSEEEKKKKETDDAVEADLAADAPAVQTGFPGQDTVEPNTVVSKESSSSTYPQEPVRTKDGAPISVTIGNQERIVNDSEFHMKDIDDIFSGFGSDKKGGK